MDIESMLVTLGCNRNCLGFKYIRDLVDMSINHINIEPLTQVGYKILAEKYGKSSNSIEKNIQNCINSAWSFGDPEVLYENFRETISDKRGKPTNKHFLYTVIEKVKSLN